MTLNRDTEGRLRSGVPSSEWDPGLFRTGDDETTGMSTQNHDDSTHTWRGTKSFVRPVGRRHKVFLYVSSNLHFNVGNRLFDSNGSVTFSSPW